MYLAILGCSGLYWAVRGCTGLYGAVLCCTGLYWAVLGCTGRSQQLLFCVFSHFRHGDMEQTNEGPGDTGASLFLTSVIRQYFAKSFNLILIKS